MRREGSCSNMVLVHVESLDGVQRYWAKKAVDGILVLDTGVLSKSSNSTPVSMYQGSIQGLFSPVPLGTIQGFGVNPNHVVEQHFEGPLTPHSLELVSELGVCCSHVADRRALLGFRKRCS